MNMLAHRDLAILRRVFANCDSGLGEGCWGLTLMRYFHRGKTAIDVVDTVRAQRCAASLGPTL
jgi:hypothetical protein